MTLITNLYAKILATETVVGDLEAATTSLANSDPVTLASGTGTNQADVLWSDTRTLAASANESLDLNALTDSVGRTRNFAKVKALLISAAATNTNNVQIGNGVNPFQMGFVTATSRWNIPPGGSFMVTAPAAGWASTDGVSDTLLVANAAAGTSVDYTLTLIGCSA